MARIVTMMMMMMTVSCMAPGVSEGSIRMMIMVMATHATNRDDE